MDPNFFTRLKTLSDPLNEFGEVLAIEGNGSIRHGIGDVAHAKSLDHRAFLGKAEGSCLPGFDSGDDGMDTGHLNAFEIVLKPVVPARPHNDGEARLGDP